MNKRFFTASQGSKDPHSVVIGLSIERPILDHHAKAHIHEIRRISREIRRISWNPWNLADFMKSMKSSGFHEIRQISPWNLADFTMKSDVSAKFYKVWGGFHEIRWISYEICWISWNLLDFIQISWNLPDFIWISWNPPDFIRISCEIERPLQGIVTLCLLRIVTTGAIQVPVPRPEPEMYSFCAKMNGKVEFYAWFPLWFINIQRVVNFLWMGISHMVKIQRHQLKFSYLFQSDYLRWH